MFYCSLAALRHLKVFGNTSHYLECRFYSLLCKVCMFFPLCTFDLLNILIAKIVSQEMRCPTECDHGGEYGHH
jgi:hypothetical protein